MSLTTVQFNVREEKHNEKENEMEKQDIISRNKNTKYKTLKEKNTEFWTVMTSTITLSHSDCRDLNQSTQNRCNKNNLCETYLLISVVVIYETVDCCFVQRMYFVICIHLYIYFIWSVCNEAVDHFSGSVEARFHLVGHEHLQNTNVCIT